MSNLAIKDLADPRPLDTVDMQAVSGGKGQDKDVFIFSSETLTILGQHDLARFRKLEEDVLNSGHHE
jgi:hypothetical protein